MIPESSAFLGDPDMSMIYIAITALWASFGYSMALYLAGLLGLLQGEERFVILTRAANPSVAPVHARMPVLLPPGSLHAWFFEPERVPALLLAEPGSLSCSPVSASPAQPELPGFFTP